MTIAELHERLDSFRLLEPDWDTYGSPPICHGAIARAKVLLDALLQAGIRDLPYPCPVNGGAVMFEWHDGCDEAWGVIEIPTDKDLIGGAS